MKVSDIKIHKFYVNKTTGETTTDKDLANLWAKQAHVGIVTWSSVCNEYLEIAEMYY